MGNKWNTKIKQLRDNTPIFIILKDLDFYKDETGKNIFFDNEKDAYDFIQNKGMTYIQLYLSRYRF